MELATRRRRAAGGRNTTRTSCGECRRRRQKCDQRQPCGRCARRFPPPICHYGDEAELDDLTVPTASALVRHEADILGGHDGETTRFNKTRAFFRLMELAFRHPGAENDTDDGILTVYTKLHIQHTASVCSYHEPNDLYQHIIIPYCVQRPLLSKIFLYLGTGFFAETGQVHTTRVIHAKVRALHHLHDGMQRMRPVASDDDTTEEQIVAIVMIINNELSYGYTQSVVTHVRGLSEIVRFYGGLAALGMQGLLAKMVIVTDLVTALSFEMQPVMHGWQSIGRLDASQHRFRWSHNTPLCTTLPEFTDICKDMGIHPDTARILDDVRVLVRLVTDQYRDPTPSKGQKLKTTAKWLQRRFEGLPVHAPPPDPSAASTYSAPQHNMGQRGSPPPIITPPTSDNPNEPPSDYVYQSVRQTALLLCRAVLLQQPFRNVLTPTDLVALWGSMWRVSLDKWAPILGIFVWIQATIAPAAVVMGPSVAVKSMFPVSMLQLAKENWNVAQEVFANGLRIQQWLQEGCYAANQDHRGHVLGDDGSSTASDSVA